MSRQKNKSEAAALLTLGSPAARFNIRLEEISRIFHAQASNEGVHPVHYTREVGELKMPPRLVLAGCPGGENQLIE